ncbi:uncharacterized protein N7446_010581 [Penicillium canescens]|uniref:uncharacterized protein n=1 Tax=Penicillium canescens TaxID=5083 RepID=UPI0026DF4212|nr:uncharacterized protein N7446_010581 [Penicillium canescens]KAJ6050472.1 hypothetical protein N7446_010581 [Penicillium canescens]KAJ6064776.1 hypothetical protein N7444_000429 [Penicillium canescens]
MGWVTVACAPPESIRFRLQRSQSGCSILLGHSSTLIAAAWPESQNLRYRPSVSADNINFGPESIYRVLEDSVKARTTIHLAKTMGLAQFAREVIDEIITGKSDSIWKGSNAFMVWFLNAVGPRNVLDSTLLKGAGLDKEEARPSIFKLGQVKGQERVRKG